jgi:hypothetical protein
MVQVKPFLRISARENFLSEVFGTGSQVRRILQMLNAFYAYQAVCDDTVARLPCGKAAVAVRSRRRK